MKRILFFSILVCLVFACLSEQERKLRLIAGDKFKYWLVLERDSKRKTKTIYRFSRNGKWETFNKYANGLFEKYDGGDIVLAEKWNFDQDKINSEGMNYTIVKLDASNFYLEFKNDTIKMIPAHDSLLISKYKPIYPRYRFYVKKIETDKSI